MRWNLKEVMSACLGTGSGVYKSICCKVGDNKAGRVRCALIAFMSFFVCFGLVFI